MLLLLTKTNSGSNNYIKKNYEKITLIVIFDSFSFSNKQIIAPKKEIKIIY